MSTMPGLGYGTVLRTKADQSIQATVMILGWREWVDVTIFGTPPAYLPLDKKVLVLVLDSTHTHFFKIGAQREIDIEDLDRFEVVS